MRQKSKKNWSTQGASKGSGHQFGGLHCPTEEGIEKIKTQKWAGGGRMSDDRIGLSFHEKEGAQTLVIERGVKPLP